MKSKFSLNEVVINKQNVFEVQQQNISNDSLEKLKEHLEEMAEITRHLSYNDIKLLRKNVDNGKKKNISKEIEQKEIQE